jgi:SAM-dependent methyltransferase
MYREGQLFLSDSQSKYLQLNEAELFAELYQAAFDWGTTYETLSLDFIWKRTLGTRPQRVCEIGSGTGRFCIPLIQQGLYCLAVEPDRYMLRVLQRNQRTLLPEVAERLKVVAHPFEELEVKESFDAIIAMTDTASYFWPIAKFRKLLERSRKMLHQGGVLVLDVGLWGPRIPKTRKESWMAVVDKGYVKADYLAKLLETNSNENGHNVRRETLSFEGELEGVKVRASRESVLHAFTYTSISDLCEEAGFLPLLQVIPGTREMVAGEGDYERLIIAFS